MNNKDAEWWREYRWWKRRRVQMSSDAVNKGIATSSVMIQYYRQESKQICNG